jgi:hypothetical protein
MSHAFHSHFAWDPHYRNSPPPLFSVLTLYIIQLGGKDITYQKFFSQKTMEHLNNLEVRDIHHLPEMLSQETVEHMTD